MYNQGLLEGRESALKEQVYVVCCMYNYALLLAPPAPHRTPHPAPRTHTHTRSIYLQL